MKSAPPNRKTIILGLSIAALLSFSPLAASACNGVLFSFDNVFSGTSEPGPAPWFQALFEDISPGTVRVTLTAPHLAPGEKVEALYLNLNPNFQPTDLHFSLVDISPGVSPPKPSAGVDAFQANGSGSYDLAFQFSQDPNQGFVAGDHLIALITGIPGLCSANFAYLSQPNGTQGPFYAAAHVGCDNGMNGWIAPTTLTPVPEPSSSVLLVLGIVALAGRGLRKRRPEALRPE